MRRVQADDASAFAELYDRHHAVAYRVAELMCSCAEDAVQDGFISARRDRAGYREDRTDARAWLFSVVREQAIAVSRREAAIAPADDARAGERRFLGELPAAQREVIALAFYGQLTHQEIAAHLNLPPGTVRGRMRLGLRRLGESLHDAA